MRRLTQAAQTIHSVHDLEGNRIAEYDYDETTQVATLIREYIWMDGMAVAVVEGGSVYFIRTDHIGRPSFATDSTATKIWDAQYLPFGGVFISTGTPVALRFPGQWFQSESGLHQNWMRDYDPTTGRYIQADPLGLVDGASVYGYALQNPGRYTDPTGEFIPALAVAAAAGAAVGAGLDLLEQMSRNEGRFECINWKSVGTSALFGAAASALGPTGGLLGRGSGRSVRYGYNKSAGYFNRSKKRRFGWSPNRKTGRDVLSFRRGTRHRDFPKNGRLGPRSGANPGRDGAVAGSLAWLLNPVGSGEDICACVNEY